MKLSDFPNLVDCEWSANRETANNDEVAHLESMIGVILPSEYRKFITLIGPGYLDGWVPCKYPTPFGNHGVTSLNSINEAAELLDSLIVPRNMICIGSGDFGALTCLSVCSLDRGAIYSFDTEMNYYKNVDDSQQSGSDSANEFYRLRDRNELPPRPCGYENCYHIADSFTDFIKSLRPSSTKD